MCVCVCAVWLIVVVQKAVGASVLTGVIGWRRCCGQLQAYGIQLFTRQASDVTLEGPGAWTWLSL